MLEKGYAHFLMTTLALDTGVIGEDEPYDEAYLMGIVLYQEFEGSDYADESMSEYDAIQRGTGNPILINNDTYSATTGKQMTYLRGELRGQETIYLDNDIMRCVAYRCPPDVLQFITTTDYAINARLQKYKRARTEYSKDRHLNEIKRLIKQANFILVEFKLEAKHRKQLKEASRRWTI